MDVRKELEAKGCIHESGHFVGTSGNHLSGYSNIDALLPHVSTLSNIVRLAVLPFAKSSVETVAAPATGGIPLAHWGAHHLEQLTGKTMYAVWGDKAGGGGFAFERDGFLKAIHGKRVLIIEDMINTMFSVRAMIDLVKQSGGVIVGVTNIIGRKEATAKKLGVPKFVQLCDIAYDVWTPEDCKKNGLCAKQIPIVEDIGHGEEFKAHHPEYPGGFQKLQVA